MSGELANNFNEEEKSNLLDGLKFSDLLYTNPITAPQKL